MEIPPPFHGSLELGAWKKKKKKNRRAAAAVPLRKKEKSSEITNGGGGERSIFFPLKHLSSFYMYVIMYVCTYTYTHIFILYIYVHTHICVYIHMLVTNYHQIFKRASKEIAERDDGAGRTVDGAFDLHRPRWIKS